VQPALQGRKLDAPKTRSTLRPRQRAERQLARVVAADIAGYPRLMGADEEGMLASVKAYGRDLIDPGIDLRRGRIPGH
jgi:adenylate cyclase